jgi:hypothetical protein
MFFFATGHVTRPAEIGPYLEEEKRVLAELREDGVVREAFSPAFCRAWAAGFRVHGNNSSLAGRQPW